METQTDVRVAPGGYLRFEDLIADLLARFLNVADGRLDSEIETAVRRIAEFLGLDQGLLIQWWEDADRPALTHAWTTHGKPSAPVSPGTQVVPWVHRQVALGRTVMFSSLDDLPEEAGKDKEFFRDSGRRALISLPMRVGEKVIGTLVFASLSSEILWSEQVVRRLQLIADVFVNMLDRRKSRRELEERLRFEMMLAETSARLINLPVDWIEDEIRDVQREVCESLDLDRSVLWLVSDRKSGRFELATYYQGDGVMAVSKGLDPEPIFPWTVARVRSGETVVISKLSDLPPEAARDRQSFMTYSTKSTLVIPLSAGNGTVFGGLTFALVSGERNWREPLVGRLKLVGEIFASALARRQAERQMRESEQRLALTTESAGVGLWSIDYGSNRLWLSSKMRQLFHFPPDKELDYLSFLKNVLPEDQEQFQETVGRAFQAGEDFRVEYRVPRPDGSHCWMVTRGRLQFDSSGKPESLMGACVEITERKNMEEQLRERLAQIEQLQRRCESENLYLQEEVKQLGGATRIEGQSAALQRVLKQARQVAGTGTTVLIMGETGTGKELLARSIHAMSKRSGSPLVTVNCAALPPMLIESELFGREKGAYTGALTKMVGRFEVADGTTIFLDEIGELPLELQGKLLRVIEEGTFERLGSTKVIRVDVRIIAATNRDLAREVKEGRFRSDLFYRLNVFPLVIPPLRERPEDVPLLVWAFVREFQEKMGKRIDSISKRTMESLQSHGWPGNGRELRNVIERAMIVSKGRTLEVSLSETAAAVPPREEKLSLADIERRHIISVLDRTSWRVTGKGGAAEALGLKGSTLQSRMKKLGIRRPCLCKGEDQS